MTEPGANLWPPVAEFNPMLQNPGIGFDDAELKTCQIQRDSNNQPRPRSGAFAVCFKGTFPTGKDVCVRLFAKKSDERRERYAEISKHLEHHPVDCLVKFKYIEKGIRCPDPNKWGKKSWFPIIRMDWIEGQVLYDWLREKCQAQDSRAIVSASEQWIEIAQQLEAAGIAHGDLQHANVMVTPDDKLKLVDYDCMCVPSLIGRTNLEMGVEPYQHPDRNDDTKLFPELDRFSQLFILVVLRALAADPSLWFQFIEPMDVTKKYDKLLFRRSDFDDPGTSAVFAALTQSSDREVERLTRELFKLVKGPMNAVPALSTFVFNFDELRAVFQRREWDEGLELLSRGSSMKLPKDLSDMATRARQCVDARLELERALQSGDERQIQAAYKPALLDDYPRAHSAVQAAKLSPRVQTALGKLESAKAAKSWRQFVAAWDADQAILAGRKSAERYSSNVRDWRERNDLSARIKQLRSASAIDVAQLEQACRALTSAGGHPEIDAELPEIRRLIERHHALQRVQKIPDVQSEENDQALVAAWNEQLLGGWKNADSERSRLSSAKDRLEKVAKLRDEVTVANSNRSLANERSLQKLAGAIPSVYDLEPKLKARLADGKACLATVAQIEQALSSDAPSERDLARYAATLTKLQALPLLEANDRNRLELATRRLPLLKKLEDIDLRGPQDVIDKAILAAWNDHLLQDCPDAEPWKQRAAEAESRAALLAELDQALAGGNDTDVVELMKNPLFEGYPFESGVSSRVNVACAKYEQVRVMIDALRDHRDEDFSRSFDHRIVKANQPLFAPFKAQILEILNREILPIDKIGMSKPLVGRSITSESDKANKFRVQWEWPARRITDHCLVGVCQGMPDAQTDPNKIAIYRLQVDRQRLEGVGGVSLMAKPDWQARRANVVAVWAVIDLGFNTLYSEPLILGRM